MKTLKALDELVAALVRDYGWAISIAVVGGLLTKMEYAWWFFSIGVCANMIFGTPYASKEIKDALEGIKKDLKKVM